MVADSLVLEEIIILPNYVFLILDTYSTLVFNEEGKMTFNIIPNWSQSRTLESMQLHLPVDKAPFIDWL